jgi:hypothetical protein
MPEYSEALPYQQSPASGRGLQRARFYLLCALLALLAAAGALLVGASYWRQRFSDLQNMLPANVDMRLGRLTLSEAGATGQTMIVEAASALYYQAEDFFLLDDVQAGVGRASDFYDISAASGRYDQARKIITLTGRVKVVENGGGILTSDHLVLKLDDGLLVSESPFCYAAPESDLEGSSFVYHIRDRRLIAEGAVRFLF